MKQTIIFEKINYLYYFLYFFLFIQRPKKNSFDFFYIESSINKKVLTYLFPKYTSNYKKFDFKLTDLNNKKNRNIFSDILLYDYNLIFKSILNESKFFSYKGEKNYEYLKSFLRKKIFDDQSPDHVFFNTMVMINAVDIKLNDSNSNLVFFLEKRKWSKQLQEYSEKFNLKIRYKKNFFYELVSNLESVYIRSFALYLFKKIKNLILFNKNQFVLRTLNTFFENKDSHIILIHTIRDIVNKTKFWEKKYINSANSIFIDRFNNYKIDDLKQINNFENPICLENLINFNSFKYKFNSHYPVKLRKYVKEFEFEKLLWLNTFNSFKSKVYVTNHKWDPYTIPASSALNEIGGISIFYQTSYYEHLDFVSNIIADIYFCFSNRINKIEQIGGSKIKYCVATGFTKDYVFDLNKTKSLNLRQELKNNGCKKIISFFDQGFSDEKWYYGREYLLDQYIYWLNKVIDEKWLGLIIKPKHPGKIFIKSGKSINLQKGLEKYESIFTKALSTGRCYIYSDTEKYHSSKNTKISVAEAAMASDLAIHNMVFAASAGVESALSGTFTLYFDDLNFNESTLYKLGKNKIIFNDWDLMWSRIQNYFLNQNNEDINNWSQILDNIDPFRDGKASHRINQFLYWLHEDFKNKKNKNEIIENAIQKYSSIWGSDKIIKNF